MFDGGESAGWKGGLGGLLGRRRRGGSSARGLSDRDRGTFGHSTVPGSATSSTWRSTAGESKGEHEQKANFDAGRSIELIGMSPGVSPDVPVLNKRPDDRDTGAGLYHGDDLGDTTGSSTSASPDAHRSAVVGGLQRNSSTASTGAGISRSVSQKRQSGGLPNSLKRKPVPAMAQGSSRGITSDENASGEDGAQEVLTDGRRYPHRQASQTSLTASSSSGTIRPGLQSEDRSRRSSFLLIPDRPLEQDV
jgi:hypothetical protein